MYVSGICCPSEVPIIQNILSPLPGVFEVNVNVTGRQTIVEHDPSLTPPPALVNALNEVDLGASIQHGDGQITEKRSSLPPNPTIISGVLFVASLFHHLYALHTVPDSVKRLEYIAIGCVVIGLPTILRRAFNSLRVYVLDYGGGVDG